MTRNPILDEGFLKAMLEHICIPIQEGLLRVENSLSAELCSGIETVDSVVRYVIKNGGKRIRPTLFLLSARVAGATGEHMPRIAAAVEMLHTASLMHDDVVDDAVIRRGLPSAKAKWGNQVSVLVGDLLLCRASRILVSYGNGRLLTAAMDAIDATTQGELLEIAHQNNIETGAEIYMKIIKGKTASLFMLASRIPAIDAGLSPSLENGLATFGDEVGQAFQLADDALDYIADECRFGKVAGTDLREGKLTYPLIVALSKASADERISIRNALIAGRASQDEFSAVRAIIDRHGGIEATWNIANSLAERAKGRLLAFKPSIERDAMATLADYAVNRKE